MLLVRLVVQLFVAAFILLCIDGFVHRDPTVDLRHGYQIVATSASSPCFLTYQPWIDERESSGWHAIASTTSDGLGGGERNLFLLTHDEQDWLQFDDEEEWRSAWQKKKATFGPKEIGSVEGITGFRDEGRHVLGTYAEGYFILDVDENRVQTWENRDAWSRAVRTAVGTSVGFFRDPKSWLVQSRSPALLGVAAAPMLLWCVWPIVRPKSRYAKALRNWERWVF